MVPKGWRLVEANDICSSISVGVVIKPSQYYVEKDKGVKAFRSANVREGFINDSDWVYFSDEGHQANKKSQLKAGDVLIVRTGYPGTACVVTQKFEGSNAIDIVIARPRSDLVTSEYLCSYTNSEVGKSQVINLKGGMAQQHLNVGAYKVLKIKLPPLVEQRKIANILSTWDKVIGTIERLIDNSTQQKKALMQQLLTGKKRLLDESGKRFAGEWSEVKLNAVVKVTGGNAFKSTDFKEAGIPLIKISNIKSDYSVSIESSVFISLDQKYDKFQVKNGDVLIAMSGATTGKIGKYTFDGISYLNQRVGRFDVRKDLTTKSYLFQLLKLPKVQHEILIDAVGGAQPNISNKDIERIKVSIPPLKEQQKIATVLTNADKEIELLEQQLADLQQEKKALMQVLLTGKKRVDIQRSIF